MWPDKRSVQQETGTHRRWRTPTLPAAVVNILLGRPFSFPVNAVLVAAAVVAAATCCSVPFRPVMFVRARLVRDTLSRHGEKRRNNRRWLDSVFVHRHHGQQQRPVGAAAVMVVDCPMLQISNDLHDSAAGCDDRAAPLLRIDKRTNKQTPGRTIGGLPISTTSTIIPLLRRQQH